MAIDFRIQTNTYDECGYIHVEDITAYGTEDRDDYALALYVRHGVIGGTLSVDQNLTDFTNPGSADYPAEWFVPTENQQEYDTEVFLVPVWAAGSYDEYCIVYHEGTFWINVSGGITTDTPESGSDWTAIDETDTGYNYFMSGVSNSPTTVLRDTDTNIMTCSIFSIVNTDCHIYKVENTLSSSPVLTPYTITVKNYVGETIAEYTAPSPGASLNITLPEDGVYVFDISQVEYHVIYDWCDLQTCVVNLIQYILCTADDPCTEHCDPAAKSKLRRYRDELNLINGLYWPLYAYIHTDKMKYIGVFTEPDSDRLEHIELVGDMITKLNLITDRCGVCDDSFNASDCSC